MQRPEEDQPNVELPTPRPLPTATQHWRVEVPHPASTLVVGQRVPKGEHKAGFGFPGVSVATEASFFADVFERTLWQGHDVIAFQSPSNAELHSGHAVVLGATDWSDTDPAEGEHLARSGGQSHLYAQLRAQAIGFDAAMIARTTLGIAKTLLNFPLAKVRSPSTFLSLGVKSNLEHYGKAAVKAGLSTAGLGASGYGIEVKAEQLKALDPASVTPAPGVHVTSHSNMFFAANGSTNVLAAKGYTLLAGTTYALHAGVTATLSALGAIDVHAAGAASVSSLISSELASVVTTNVVAKKGEATISGKTVQVGRKVPNDIAAGSKLPSALQRVDPTRKVTLEALQEIKADVVGKFVINAPVGEVTSESRKTKVSAVDSVTLKTPLGEIVINATSIVLKHSEGSVVKLQATGVEVNTVTAQVKVDATGSVSLRSLGGMVRMDPGGIISVQGTLVKLG